METILAAVLPAAVTGGLALVGVILSNRSSERRMHNEQMKVANHRIKDLEAFHKPKGGGDE